MTPEERKEYNRKYYEKNKQISNAKLFTKESCKSCGRSVSHQNMPKHLKSKLCQNRSVISVQNKDDIKNDTVDLSYIISKLDKIYDILQHKKLVEHFDEHQSEYDPDYNSDQNTFTYNGD